MRERGGGFTSLLLLLLRRQTTSTTLVIIQLCVLERIQIIQPFTPPADWSQKRREREGEGEGGGMSDGWKGLSGDGRDCHQKCADGSGFHLSTFTRTAHKSCKFQFYRIILFYSIDLIYFSFLFTQSFLLNIDPFFKFKVNFRLIVAIWQMQNLTGPRLQTTIQRTTHETSFFFNQF